jgi:cell division protein FtsB
MEPAVINGIFTLTGVIIGGVLSFVTSKDEKEKNALNRQIKELQDKNTILHKEITKLCAQVSAYWNIEKAYSEELAQVTNQNSKSVLKKRRDIIERNGYVRPTMTEKETRDILEKL